MIKQEEYVCKNGTVLIHTYSDIGYKIKQIETGIIYADAYDIPGKYTYMETDEKINELEEELNTH